MQALHIDAANPCAICQEPNPTPRCSPGFQVCPRCLRRGRIVDNFNPRGAAPYPFCKSEEQTRRYHDSARRFRRNVAAAWHPIERN